MTVGRHVLVDTSVLYPSVDSPSLNVTDRERKVTNEIVGEIHRGNLPTARVLTSIQQEVFDHLLDEAGQNAVRSTLGFLRQSPNFEFHSPARDVVAAGRRIVERKAEFEFADGQIAAYLNQLDQHHRVVYTLDGKFEDFPGITPLPTPHDPYT